VDEADRWAAERFGVSHTTAARWAARYRQPGAAGMHDRTRPPASQPSTDTVHLEARVLTLRRAHRIGPVRPAARTGVAPSTAHRILARHGVAPPGAMRLDHRRTRPPL